MKTVLTAIGVCLLAAFNAAARGLPQGQTFGLIPVAAAASEERESSAAGRAEARKALAGGPDQFVPMAACRLLDTRVDPAASPAQEAVRTIKLDAADGNKFKLLYGTTGAFIATPLVNQD
jgi:hypothetical protein